MDLNQPLTEQRVNQGLSFYHSSNPSSNHYSTMHSLRPKDGEVSCSRRSHKTTKGINNMHIIKISDEYQIHMITYDKTSPMSSRTKKQLLKKQIHGQDHRGIEQHNRSEHMIFHEINQLASTTRCNQHYQSPTGTNLRS